MRMPAGLQPRFLLAMLATLAMVLVVLGAAWLQQRDSHREIAALSRGSLHEHSLAALRGRGEAMASLLADALTNPVYYFDLLAVREVARSALSQRDVAYVLVFDAEGRVLHDGSADIPGFGQPMQDAFAFEAVAATGTHTQWSRDYVDVTHPIRIGGERLGGVRVGLSLAEPLRLEAATLAAMEQRANEASARSLGLLAGLFAALVGIGVLLVQLVSRGLVRPIRSLAEAARAMEAGQYQLRLESTRRDEIGELIRAFDRMSESVDRHDRDIRRIAYGDSLTGLPNRLAFRELLDQELTRRKGSGEGLALLFVDLDDFKRINDTLGHDAGDEVLSQFAERIRHCVEIAARGEVSRVARFGGDEFVALLAGPDVRDAAAHAAESILTELQHPVGVMGRSVFLGASVGITLFPDDAHSSTVLLKNGDIAMYQAKVAGKNCYRFYSKAMDQAVERRVQLEQDLRGAWERGELSLCYQPIVALADGRILGAEALLRWQHPRLGAIPPSVFVDVAEQTGLIDGIGRAVLARACRDAMHWPMHCFVSVNLSARQLRAEDLVEQVRAVLGDSGLPAARLHLELTETAVLGDETQASALLARLRSMGVRIWLDDFGTGFSGLSHLRRVPVDGVKIDRSFIADMLRDPDDLALTSAIIAMAHSLGITVVGEGVESEGQLAMLRERGCDHAQGFWLGRPMSSSELILRLRDPAA
jgi:diguanylate cyclase (GGDEF)-like protein